MLSKNGRELRYFDEIWLADRLLPAEGSNIKNTKPDVVLSGRGRILKIDMTLYFRSRWSRCYKTAVFLHLHYNYHLHRGNNPETVDFILLRGGAVAECRRGP